MSDKSHFAPGAIFQHNFFDVIKLSIAVANNTRFCMMLQPFVILETLCTFSWDSTFITGQIMGSFQMSFDIKACWLIRAVITLDHFGLFSFPVLSLVIVQFLFCTKHFSTLVTNLLSFVMSVSVMPQRWFWRKAFWTDLTGESCVHHHRLTKLNWARWAVVDWIGLDLLSGIVW